MVACARPFPIVVTTNSGYPLDQNLYQTVKGMSAAAQVVSEGGYIAAASRCNDGFPDHGNFKKLLFEHDSPRALLDTIEAPGFSMYDQWEAQLLAIIRLKARVGLVERDPGRRRCAARTSSRSPTWAPRSTPSSSGSDETPRWPSCPRGR